MKFGNRHIAAMLILCMVIPLGSALAVSGAGGLSSLFTPGNQGALAAQVFPLGGATETCVTWEIVTEGQAGETEEDTVDAAVRFTLENPGAEPVSFDYTVLSGSAETGQHLKGYLSGSVTLSLSEPAKTITIEVKPLADNPGAGHPIPNNPNALWTGERLFYLYCGGIQNALFDGGRQSLTLPVPIKSDFDYAGSYAAAAAARLIDLDAVSGGTGGVFSLTLDSTLTLTGTITGDVRKMLDAGVFTHVLLPGGALRNKTDEGQTVSYQAIAYRNSEDLYGTAAYPRFPSIFVPANNELSFYTEDFTQSQPVRCLNLGPRAESNGVFSRLSFLWDGNDISVHFTDENGQYEQWQVCFSDEAAPTVQAVSADAGGRCYYGDQVPVTVTFSEPVYTDDISFQVGGVTLRPLEAPGTISESVSFLHTVGDEALGTGAVTVMVTEITGAVDLSGKAQEADGTGDASLNIGGFDAKRALLYCARPEAAVDQGTARTATVNISVPLKADLKLRAWLADGPRLDGTVSKVLKARAVTESGAADIALAVVPDGDDLTKAASLTGSFTAPENTTDADIAYALEFYLDTGGGFQLLRGLTAAYTIPPIVLVDEESDVTLTYTGWPPSNRIFADAASSLSLGYTMNVDATWQQSTYFVWSSSDETVATIDQSGNITVRGPGTVSFSLTVSNPISEDTVILTTPTLTVAPAGGAYLYVPDALSTPEVLKGSGAKVSLSTNITALNDAASTGAETTYTFALYSADYAGGQPQRGASVWQSTQTATVAAPVTACAVPAEALQTATEKGVYGYVLDITAQDEASGDDITATAYIRVRERPAKAVLTRPAKLYLTDGTGSFSVAAGAENTTANTEYRLTVTRNSIAIFPDIAVTPGAVTAVPVAAVDAGRLMDVYAVSLRVKNPDDPAWSTDSFCVNVYRGGAMRFLVESFPTGGLRVELKPNLVEGTVYNVGALRARGQLGLSKSIRLDNRVGWSGANDQITWSVSGESASLWHGQTRIRSGESLTLPPNASLQIVGDGAGTATVTATHARTDMSVSQQVVVGGVDQLYLFQSAPKAHGRLVYTNGNGVEKNVLASQGSAGVYEPSGIASDVVFYPEDTASYDFAVLTKNALDAGQKKASAFDLYPVHTLRISEVNHQVSLSLFDEATGAAYTGEITVRGGLYVNGEYYRHTKINGNRGDANQTAKADSLGQYTLLFDVRDYYTFGARAPSPSDELRYVIEVSFGTDYFPLYVTVENADIQARKSSGLGVSVSAGIKRVDASLVQNKVIVLSQSVTLDGKELSLDDSLLKLDDSPSQALLNMKLLLPDYRDDQYYLQLEDGTGKFLGYAGRGEAEHPYPFSDIVTLSFSSDIRTPLYWMIVGRLETGETGYIYPSVERVPLGSGDRALYRLSKPVRVQSLVGVAAMKDWEIMDDISLVKLIESLTPGYQVPSLSTGIGLVDEALGIARGVSAYPYQKLIGLEISSTDDPLVYKGILRYAAGREFFRDSSMRGGLYMRADDPANYSFLPHHRFTGEGKTAFMRRARSGNSTTYLSGGAYAECILRYNLSSKAWELSIVKVDLDMRVSREYERRYNTYIGPVPVTAKFTTELSMAAGLTVLHTADGRKTAYIPRLSPGFSIRGSGGVGRDYKVVALWAGPYGKAGMTQNYLWYRDSDGQTANGQRLSIAGAVGVAFEIKLGPFWTEDGEYELTSYENSWTYNDYDEITGLISGGLPSSGRMFASDTVGLVPVSETIRYADRAYLDRFERAWGEPSGRMAGRGGAPTATLERNANPDSAPRLAGDGGMLAYLSDMGSADLRDTAAVFSLRDGSGAYLPSREINASPYPDDALALSGTESGGACAVWLRYFTDESGGAGGEPAMEDVVNALASAEVMAAIYDPVAKTFATTRLTNNATPEMSPATAFAGGKAVAAWVGAAPGDLEHPLDFTASWLMYAVYTGTGWTDAKVLYDGSLAQVTALSAAMMADGTTAILYQVTGGEGDSDIFCAVLDAGGAVLRTLRLSDSGTENTNPQLAAVEFPDGAVRFVAGWNQVDESGRLSIRLAAVNADGTPYPALSLQLSDDGSLRDYDGFLLSKGAQTLEQLSVLWCEAQDADGDDTYGYSVYGAKPVELPGGGFSLSGGARLLALSEGTTLRALDARTVSDTELQLVMVTQEPSTEAGPGEATMSTVMAAYQAAVSVAEPQFLYVDLVPGLELPVSFTVRNDGMEPITEIDLALGGSTFAYTGLNLLPGSSETFTVLYPVPETVADAAYTVTVTFGSAGGTTTATGTLKLNLPDVGIAQIDATQQGGRERGFRVLLENSGYAPLVPGTHSVRLEAWDDPNFDGLDDEKTPLWSQTLYGTDITALSGSPLPVNVTLNAAALAPLLIDGEIPDGGAWVYFRVVLLENGTDTQDAESGNDLDYIQIHSLIEQYGKKVALSSALEMEGGGATLRVNAANNAMGALTNGGIVATLRDAAGNALETQRTASPLNIAGESSDTVTLTFTATGHSADVTFVTTATGSVRLSDLKLTGVPLAFDPDVQDYTVQTYDLSAVTLTAVAEDPAATLTVRRDGAAIYAAGPLALPYEETVFTVTVTASGGDVQATYTVRIQNRSTQSPPSSGGFERESQSAELKIGGVSRSGLRVRISGGQASVALGELAREVFDGSAGAALTVPVISGVDRYLLELPAEALSGETSGVSLTLDTPIARISLPAGMLGGMTDLAGKTAGIAIANANETALSAGARAAVGSRPVLSLALTLDGVQADWSNPDAPVTVSIPYVPTAEEWESLDCIVVWYIDGGGSLHCVTNGRYKPETGTVTFETTHFSLYAVGYNLVAFADVAPAAWYADAVRYLAARGITTGTAATTFSPDAPLTRGQFITLLLRAYGIETIDRPTDNFSDAGDTYYTGYLAAAKQLGISNGVGGNNFAPEAAITRQEMFTLLYNALSMLEKLPDGNSGKTLSAFTDRESIAAYAREALAYLVAAGAVSGSNGYLLPEATATRAQVAQVLYNLLRE